MVVQNNYLSCKCIHKDIPFSKLRRSVLESVFGVLFKQLSQLFSSFHNFCLFPWLCLPVIISTFENPITLYNSDNILKLLHQRVFHSLFPYVMYVMTILPL